MGYDHVNYDSLSGSGQSAGGQPSGYSEVFSASAGYALKPGMLLGVETGWSPITYTTISTNTPYSNANQWNAGGYYDTPVSEYIHFTGHAGYTVYTPEANGTTTLHDSSGLYAQLDLTHRVNEYVDYTLSGGKTIGTSFWGGAVDQDFVNLRANWRIVRKVTVSTSFSYFHGTYLYNGGGTYDQYGPGISFSRPITAKLSSSLGYQFYLRDSNSAGQNYTASIVSLNFNYSF
jgi:hypothetical protein